MSDDAVRRAKEVFLVAAGMEEPARLTYLEEACAGDPALRAEVDSLLGAHDTAGGRSAPEWTRLQDETEDVVEGYRLLDRLGDGGMGVVWEAEQQHPVQRRVALKLVRRGMDTKEVLARFDAELRAMARMEHPAIAKVYAAGTTARGRPFFAMELVRGLPVTTYCTQHRLSVTERLELFIGVCQGVQHAHQKGMIHRDLKPSNILVVEQDGRPAPKIIDFGIAKAASDAEEGDPGLTRHGDWIGTPEYMSPEQAGLGRQDVDTRSDVYSLGVVLYELLTGAVPFELDEPSASALDDIRRRIREQDPPRPSTRVRASDTSEAIAASRRCSSPGVLVRTLRRELDWIVMRALEKDRARRYGSAGELAADVRRFLADEPVQAGPPTAAYRLAKLVRRNRAAAGAAMLVLLALLVGVTGLSVGLVRAQREARAARQVAAALEHVLAGADPGSPFGQTSSPRQLLDRGVAQISSRLADRPRVQARLLVTVAWGYRNLGLQEQAMDAARRALALQRQHLPEGHHDLASTLRTLGWIAFDLARFDDALAAQQEGLRILEAAPRQDPAEVAESVTALARVVWRRGDLATAGRMYRRARSLHRSAGSEGTLPFATTLLLEGELLSDLDRFDEARANYEQALEILTRLLGEDHMEVGWVLLHLGASTTNADPVRARSLLARAAAIQERALGADHPALPEFLSWLSYATLVNEQPDESARYAARAVEIARNALPPGHPILAQALYFRGVQLRNTGEPERSLRCFEEALAIRRSVFGPDHSLVGWCHNGIGLSYRDLGEVERARRSLERAASVMRGAYGLRHHSTALVHANLGQLQLITGDAMTARGTLEAALEAHEEILGPTDTRTLYTTHLLACAEARLGEVERAITLVETLVASDYGLAEIPSDPDLAPLRGHPRFAALVEEIQRRTARSAGGPVS